MEKQYLRIDKGDEPIFVMELIDLTTIEWHAPPGYKMTKIDKREFEEFKEKYDKK